MSLQTGALHCKKLGNTLLPVVLIVLDQQPRRSISTAVSTQVGLAERLLVLFCSPPALGKLGSTTPGNCCCCMSHRISMTLPRLRQCDWLL